MALQTASGFRRSLGTGKSLSFVRARVRFIVAFIGVSTLLICWAFAADGMLTGKAFVPGLEGWYHYAVGFGAWAMSVGWLCLGVVLMGASCMYSFPRHRMLFKKTRDVSALGFAASFLIAVLQMLSGIL